MAYCAVSRDAAFDVTGYAPTHGERLVELLEDTHLLHLSVAFGAVDRRLSGEVPHVRKVDVIGDLIYANPRDGLLVGPVFADLRDLRLLQLCGPADDLMAPYAGPDRRHPGVYRSLCREVTELAVDPVYSSMNVMRKSDWLIWALIKTKNW